MTDAELISKLVKLEIQIYDNIKSLESDLLDLNVHKLELEGAKKYKETYGDDYLPINPRPGVFYFWDDNIYKSICMRIEQLEKRIEALKA